MADDIRSGVDKTTVIFQPAAKIAASIFFVLAVSFDTGISALHILIYLAVLSYWAIAEKANPISVLKRSLYFIPFLVMAVLFGPSGAGLTSHSLIYLTKGFFSAIALSLLTMTTPFQYMLSGLGRLKVSPILILILSFTFRYLEVLVTEAKRMERARNLRFYGKGYLRQFRVLGYMIGSLFIRSYERGERVYTAMSLRGYAGKPVQSAYEPFRIYDFILVGSCAVAAILIGADSLCRYFR